MALFHNSYKRERSDTAADGKMWIKKIQKGWQGRKILIFLIKFNIIQLKIAHALPFSTIKKDPVLISESIPIAHYILHGSLNSQ